MQKRKTKLSSNSIFGNTLKGVMTGVISYIVLLSIFSLIILKTNIPSNLFFIFILISIGISVFIGSTFSSFIAKKSRFLNGMLTDVILIVIDFVLLLCFNNASLSVKIYLIIPVAIIFGFFGSAIGSNIRKR